MRKLRFALLLVAFITCLGWFPRASAQVIVTCDGQGVCITTVNRTLLPLFRDDFRPDILNAELRRAIIFGSNPPGKPMQLQPVGPAFLSRPVEIPKAYPARQNNGVQFIQE